MQVFIWKVFLCVAVSVRPSEDDNPPGSLLKTSAFVYKSGEQTWTKITRRKRNYWCNCLTQAVSWTPQRFLNLHWPLRRSRILPTQMVLVESSLLPWVHSQWKDPATLRHAPLMHGLDSHSLMSGTQASTQLRSELVHHHCLTHTHCYRVCVCALTFTGLWLRLENKPFRTEACVGARSVSALAVVTEQTVHQTLVDVCQKEETECCLVTASKQE